MGIRSYVKNTVKNNSNVKSWSSWDAIKDNAKVIGLMVKDIKDSSASAATPVIPQTFEQAAAKFNLSPADLQKRMTRHLWVSIGCAILGVSALGWAIFLFLKVMLLSGVAGLSLAALMFSYAFQENFRYFLIKQRRLNCTVHEWFSSFFENKKR